MSGCDSTSNMGTPTSAKALKISFQVRLRPPRLAKVPSHRQNQNQLHPLRWLKVHRPDLDPAPARPKPSCPTSFTADKRHEADAVGPRNPVDELVVVDQRKQEHRDHAAADPVDLLGMEADDTSYAASRSKSQARRWCTSSEHDSEQRPVEVAKTHDAAHRAHWDFTCRHLPRQGWRQVSFADSGPRLSTGLRGHFAIPADHSIRANEELARVQLRRCLTFCIRCRIGRRPHRLPLLRAAWVPSPEQGCAPAAAASRHMPRPHVHQAAPDNS